MIASLEKVDGVRPFEAAEFCYCNNGRCRCAGPSMSRTLSSKTIHSSIADLQNTEQREQAMEGERRASKDSISILWFAGIDVLTIVQSIVLNIVLSTKLREYNVSIKRSSAQISEVNAVVQLG